MAGLWQVCEGTLNLSLIGLEPLAQVFFLCSSVFPLNPQQRFSEK